MFLLVPLSGAATAQSQSLPRVTADSAVLIEWETGAIIYGKEAFKPRHPASLTKIVTAAVVVDEGYLGDVVEVSSNAASTPGSSMGIRAGYRFILGDLLKGLLLCSGNDAAVAIAEHMSGSEEAFAGLMNMAAIKAGAFNSTFRNPHGLTETGHMTTAYDMALIARYALSKPAIADIVSTREITVQRLDANAKMELFNTNKLLWDFPGADGVKTGTTDVAGKCLIASATRSAMKLICVILHSDDRWGDASRLLEWGFSNFTSATVLSKGQYVGETKVVNGMKNQVSVVADGNLKGVFPNPDSGAV